MKRLFIILALVLFSSTIFCQTTEDWLWAKKAGGTGTDEGSGIATDSNGNSYIIGRFSGTASFGFTTLISSGDYDIFIAKLDTSGNYLWAQKAGGTSSDKGTGIATDSIGNSYVTGCFQGSATFGTTTLISSGNYDIFLAKLDSNGNYLWAKSAGGAYSCESNGIAIDNSGNSYITGRFAGSATFGTYYLASSGSNYPDLFIAKANTNGNYLWAKKAGGSGSDSGYGISTDSSGNSYLTGSFSGTATFGTNSLVSNGTSDIFITKVDSNGNYLWAKNAGGAEGDSGKGISTDSSGNSYVTGSFMGSSTFGNITIYGGWISIFIAKIDINGNWMWATTVQSSYDSYSSAITTDSGGNSYVTGAMHGGATFGTISLIGNGDYNTFVTKLGPTGNYLWAKRASAEGIGQGVSNGGAGIAVDSNGKSYITGAFTYTATFGTTPVTTSGSSDIYIATMRSVFTELLPKGGETLPGTSGQNNTYPITWTFDVPVVNAEYVTLYYSLDGGATYPYLIADNEPNDGYFSWIVPNVNTSLGRIKLQVKDISNNILFELSSLNNFTIDTTPPFWHDFLIFSH